MEFFAVDDLTTYGGWASLGVISPILLWLFFWHLPAKDSQFNALVKSKDYAVKEMAAIHADAVAKMAAAHADTMKQTTAAFGLSQANATGAFADTVKAMNTEFKDAILRFHAECRQERREMWEMIDAVNGDQPRKPTA